MKHVKIDNEVSTFDLLSEYEMQGEKYYDSLDELEDLDLHETPTKQDHPIIFKTREGKEIELPQYPTPKQKENMGKREKETKENPTNIGSTTQGARKTRVLKTREG